MTLSMIGQDLGSAGALSRTAVGVPPVRSDVEETRVDAPEAAAPTTAPAAPAPQQNSVSAQAWFDLNGDGRITDWPVLYGGDAYISSSVPGVASGPVARPAGQRGGARAHHHTAAESGTSHPTAAQSRHAISSYKHDGGTKPRRPPRDPHRSRRTRQAPRTPPRSRSPYRRRGCVSVPTDGAVTHRSGA